MKKEFHKAFDEATLTKLNVFEQYFEAWLPTFIMTGKWANPIRVWDFCSGPGYDSLDNEGSPLRILKTIKKFEKEILTKDKSIIVHLNEYNKLKFLDLKENVNNYLLNEFSSKLREKVSVMLYNEDFKELFISKNQELKKGNNFLFIDQFGVKQIDEKIFSRLISYRATDFLFFISSSFFDRFGKAFSKIFPELDVEKIKKIKREKINDEILNLYRNYIPFENKVKLYPFSIKKKANIYGLIFGAKHIASFDKFLKVAWRENKINGTANYEFEEDINVGQIDLFSCTKKLNKIERFQLNLEEYINKEKKLTNIEIYLYSLSQGHLGKHAVEKLRELKKKGKIEFINSQTPNVSYKAYKSKKEIEIRVIEK